MNKAVPLWFQKLPVAADFDIFKKIASRWNSRAHDYGNHSVTGVSVVQLLDADGIVSICLFYRKTFGCFIVEMSQGSLMFLTILNAAVGFDGLVRKNEKQFPDQIGCRDCQCADFCSLLVVNVVAVPLVHTLERQRARNGQSSSTLGLVCPPGFESAQCLSLVVIQWFFLKSFVNVMHEMLLVGRVVTTLLEINLCLLKWRRVSW